MKVFKEQDYYIAYQFDSLGEYLQYYKIHKNNHKSTWSDKDNGVYAVFKKEMKPIIHDTNKYDLHTIHSLINVALQFNDKNWFMELTNKLNNGIK
jgi:uncharacterized protein YpiB (UPF0302 family)